MQPSRRWLSTNGSIMLLLRACSRIHRSEEHTSELQSLMRISYAVFCLKKKKKTKCYILPLILYINILIYNTTHQLTYLIHSMKHNVYQFNNSYTYYTTT